MTHPRFFGYGSLVNRATHIYRNTRPVRLTNWHREWVRIPSFNTAVLSVRPQAGSQIDGLTADVPGGDWSALDARETGYRREILLDFDAPTWVYAVPRETRGPGDHMILLSYLDVVIQGFLREFGPEGPHRFMATTDNWLPILNDRKAPRYPRAQTLTANETALVDALLADIDPDIRTDRS